MQTTSNHRAQSSLLRAAIFPASFLTRIHLGIVLLAAVTGASLRADTPLPLKPGEQLKYSVSWAILPGAGEITIGAQATNDGQVEIVTTTSTRHVARALLRYDATADARYDARTGELTSLSEQSDQRKKHDEHTVTFDRANGRAIYTDGEAAAPRVLEMPVGSPSDLITALLQTRAWNLAPGEARDVLVLVKDEFYQLTIHALRYEDVRTRVGTFRTLVLEPRMETTPPKGMFKKGAAVNVWISQDERHVPVKFNVQFNIGTGTATLESYTPPVTELAASLSSKTQPPAPRTRIPGAE